MQVECTGSADELRELTWRTVPDVSLPSASNAGQLGLLFCVIANHEQYVAVPTNVSVLWRFHVRTTFGWNRREKQLIHYQKVYKALSLLRI